MGKIPDTKVAEIRDRTDIVAIIGEHVQLRRAGTNHLGLCPFHNEKSPSFNVSQQKQFFYCFGCQKSGDVFRFLKSCHQKFDFIFADPPYALKELPEIPRLILEGDLLNERGIFVFEHGKNYDFSDHPRFLEHRSYGSVNFSIFR